MVKAYVINGLGIGCHQEVAHAFGQAGAEAEIIHIKQLFTGDKDLLIIKRYKNIKIVNPAEFWELLKS